MMDGEADSRKARVFRLPGDTYLETVVRLTR